MEHPTGHGSERCVLMPGACSDYSGSNTKLPKILLNGNNICMVCSYVVHVCSVTELTHSKLIPGGEGPMAAAS